MSTDLLYDSKSDKSIIIVTGGHGFIGSNFINYIYDHTYCMIYNIDKDTYASNPNNIRSDIRMSNRYVHMYADICDLMDQSGSNWNSIWLQTKIIFNFAAESHVDNSIDGPEIFTKTNIIGTHTLLEIARRYNIDFFQISTDEVYGALNAYDDPWHEERAFKPNSVYSASKASAEHLVRSYGQTYGVNTYITRCCNNFGPNQHVEKLIPKAISLISKGQKMGLYGSGDNIREWIYVNDHCKAIWYIWKTQKPDVFNIGSGIDMTNKNILRTICDILGKSYDNHVETVADRPGHDFRYALDCSKLLKTGWSPECTPDTFNGIFREYVLNTVDE